MMKETDQKYIGNFREPFRPQFHFSPLKNWMNDPNGLVYYEGEYHLFYQHNPHGVQWGHISWGHAISKDLLHWKHLPVALNEENGIMCFSGSVVVDWINSSGFGRGQKPPLVAIYTGFRIEDEQQFQCLAFSTDNGRQWTKYGKNPVLDSQFNCFRDPKVFWFNKTKKWIMVIALADEHKIGFFESANLKKWQLLSFFGPIGAIDGDWECPDLFALPVDGNSSNVKWVLKVDLPSGALFGGSGGQYFVGDFDGTTFTMYKDFLDNQSNEENQWVDYGKDFYAAASWSDLPEKDNRRIWIGWNSNWQYAADVPTMPWKNIFSIPRELGLKTISNEIRLIQKPVTELWALRKTNFEIKNIYIDEKMILPESAYNKSDVFELKVTFEIVENSAEEFGLELFVSDSQKIVIGYNRVKNILFLDRSASSINNFNSKFSGIHYSPMRVLNNQISLHLFIDKCSVEVFGNGGEVVITDLIFPSMDSPNHQIYAKNGSVLLKRLQVWQLKSIWI